MSITLVIKGPLPEAFAAMQARGVKAVSLEAMGRDTRAVCSDCHLGAVVAWFCEEPTQAPFPVGALLLYTHA